MATSHYKSFAFQLTKTSSHQIPLGKHENIDSVADAELPYWMHFEKPSNHLQGHLIKKLNIPKTVRNILFSEEERPRCIKYQDSLLLILQGINSEQKTEHEKEMPMIRLWLTKKGLLTIGNGYLQAVNDLREDMKDYPLSDQVVCFVTLLEYLISYMSERTYQLDEQLDSIEASSELSNDAISNIMKIRQDTVRMRRYALSQREAIAMAVNKLEAFSSIFSGNFSELNEAMIRQVETLKTIRERAMIIQDNFTNQIGEISNKRMYVLTIIMLIFTPAFFVMGLFSMYLPTPGMNDPLSWWLVTIFIFVSSTGLFWLFKKKKWL